MNDRDVVGELVKRVRSFSAEPQYDAKRRAWARHNTLTGDKQPLLWICPDGDGGWRDLVPPDALRCADPDMRLLEEQLLRLVYHHEHFDDDFVIEPVVRFDIPGEYTGYEYASATQTSAWGIPIRAMGVSGGAYHMDDYLENPENVERLLSHEVDFIPDTAKRRALQEKFDSAVGDDVRVQFTVPYGALVQSHLIELVHLCGLNALMINLYDDPEGLHAILGHMADSKVRLLEKLEREHLLFDNRTNVYTGSGGLGYTTATPTPDEHMRVDMMWGFADAQEFSSVSPEMFAEFALPYQSRGLNRFAYGCYGCCEPLDNKFDMIFSALPNVRRLSVSPWSHIETAAQAIGDRAVYSWKPNPALVCVDFAREDMQAQMTRLKDAAAGRCHTEIILKDIRTCKAENLIAFADMFRHTFF